MPLLIGYRAYSIFQWNTGISSDQSETSQIFDEIKHVFISLCPILSYIRNCLLFDVLHRVRDVLGKLGDRLKIFFRVLPTFHIHP